MTTRIHTVLLTAVVVLVCTISVAQTQRAGNQGPTTLFSTMYQFKGTADGGAPLIGLVADKSGTMYGTTANGGTYNFGTIFQMKAVGGRWTYSNLYSFGASGDGVSPQSSLTVDAIGNLYGTTYQGGTANLGTVFRLAPPSSPGGSWTETVLYSFQGGADGRNPYGRVAFDKSGNLYGTTQQGGPYLCTEQKLSCGTIYKLTPGIGDIWSETVLYAFQGRADGAFPDTALTIDPAGVLYGTNTFSGGTNPRFGGVVFQLAPQPGGAWTFTTLQDFYGIGMPSYEGDLILDAKGSVYGTSWSGGAAGMGFVYRLKPSLGGTWTMSTLWSFSGPDGSLPQGGVIRGPQGLLGTTYSGGDLNKCNFIGCGVVFQLTPGAGGVWTESVLYQFTGGNDGAAPQGALLRAGNGVLYGTTSAGGKGNGTVFRMK